MSGPADPVTPDPVDVIAAQRTIREYAASPGPGIDAYMAAQMTVLQAIVGGFEVRPVVDDDTRREVEALRDRWRRWVAENEDYDAALVLREGERG